MSERDAKDPRAVDMRYVRCETCGKNTPHVPATTLEVGDHHLVLGVGALRPPWHHHRCLECLGHFQRALGSLSQFLKADLLREGVQTEETQ